LIDIAHMHQCDNIIRVTWQRVTCHKTLFCFTKSSWATTRKSNTEHKNLF